MERPYQDSCVVKLIVVLVVFIFLTISDNLFAEGIDASSSPQHQGKKVRMITLPLTDKHGILPYVGGKNCNGTINEKGEVSVTNCVLTVFGTKHQLNQFMNDPTGITPKLKQAPVGLDQHQNKIELEFSSASVLTIAGKTMLPVDTELAAPNFKSTTVAKGNRQEGQDKWVVSLERKTIRYSLAVQPPDIFKHAPGLDKEIPVSLRVKQGKADGKFKWDEERQRYSLLFGDYGEIPEIKLNDTRFKIVDGVAGKPQDIPLNVWKDVENGQRSTTVKVAYNMFDLEVHLFGKESQEINSMKLTSQKQRGNPTKVRGISKGNTRKFRFPGLLWENSPYEIEASGHNRFVIPRVVTLEDFTKLKHVNEKPQTIPTLLLIELPVWTHYKTLVLQIINTRGKGGGEFIVELIDSSKVTEWLNGKTTETRTRITNREGIVKFPEVYDWKNALIIIEPTNSSNSEGRKSPATSLRLPLAGESVNVIDSGKGYLKLEVRY